MAFSLCSTKTLLLLFLISAIPVAFIISSELAKPPTHVYHYHSSGFFRECAKWDDLNRRFLVSFMEGGIGEIAVPEDHGSSLEETVLKEVTVVKDPALAGNSSLGIVVDRPRNRLLVAISDILGNKYNALAAYDLSTWDRLFLTTLGGPGIHLFGIARFFTVLLAMNYPQFNSLFSGVLEDDNDSVMDRVVDHINFGGYEGTSNANIDDETCNNENIGGGDDDKDSNDSSDSDDSDESDDSDSDDGENFIHKPCDRKKLITCTAGSVNQYYFKYIHQEPCMVSYQTGMRWLTDILRGHWSRSVNMFRMDKDTLLDLCNALETHYGLKPSRRMSVIEKVGMFLFTLAVGASNRHVQERFQHSGETVSRCMKEVLKAVCLLAVDVIKPTDPEFTDTPIQIAMDPRFMPHFKNCIGAIDGTHVRVTISAENQIPFIGRKGVPTQNIMAACGFDMQFTFVWAGWEGSAHDTRIFYEAIDSRIINFPKPPQGKYYLVDAGYPNEYGYLGPYRGERYHLQDFQRRGQPSGREEVFNRAHSSLRNVIERTFGVWKQRWKILQSMPPYQYKTQVQIVVASMALHNFIRRRSQHDVDFVQYDCNPNYVPDDVFPDIVARDNSQGLQMPSRMDNIRDSIANSLMNK